MRLCVKFLNQLYRDIFMEIIYLIIALAVGFVVAWFISSTKIKSLSIENSKLNERSGMLEKEKEKQTLDLKQEREKVIELSASLSSLKSDYSNLQQKLKNKKLKLRNCKKNSRRSLKTLPTEFLKKKEKHLPRQTKLISHKFLIRLKKK